jgi:uncharacterized protein YjiS (DUF1127 family)
MRATIERVPERPEGRAAPIEPGRTAAPMTLGTAHQPPEVAVARLVGRGTGALVRLLSGMLARWRCRRERVAVLRELRSGDDRMLKDIGLTRGEITAAVDGRLDRDGSMRRRGD